MNKLHLLAVAPLCVLAACAGAPAAPTGSASIAAGTQYCKKDRLATEGDALVCNWSASISDACDTNNIGTVRKSAVASGPSNAGRCGSGQWLVSITTR
jgi:hypothetical protein